MRDKFFIPGVTNRNNSNNVHLYRKQAIEDRAVTRNRAIYSKLSKIIKTLKQNKLFETEQDIWNRASHWKQSKIFEREKLFKTEQAIRNRARYSKQKLFETEQVTGNSKVIRNREVIWTKQVTRNRVRYMKQRIYLKQSKIFETKKLLKIEQVIWNRARYSK